jgi:hypothetical protein
MLVFPALRRQREKFHKFVAGLTYKKKVRAWGIAW